MFGMFSLLNLFASTLYPILASYKAYDSYSRIAARTGATTVNIGGVSIPLGTMFKKATSSEQSIEEDTLNYRLLHLQMWFVYWIVHACSNLAENLLFLRLLPLYFMVKLVLSLWLIAPIVISETRTSAYKVLSFQDLQHEWAEFSNSGCGMIYFVYLKPFFDEHVQVIDNFKLDSLFSMVSGGLVKPISQGIASQVFRSGSFNASNTPRDASTDYVSYFSTFFSPSESTPDSVSPGDDLVMSEYDVVSKNDSDSQEGVRNRQPKSVEESTKEGLGFTTTSADSQPAAQTKPSWFW